MHNLPKSLKKPTRHAIRTWSFIRIYVKEGFLDFMLRRFCCQNVICGCWNFIFNVTKRIIHICGYRCREEFLEIVNSHLFYSKITLNHPALFIFYRNDSIPCSSLFCGRMVKFCISVTYSMPFRPTFLLSVFILFPKSINKLGSEMFQLLKSSMIILLSEIQSYFLTPQSVLPNLSDYSFSKRLCCVGERPLYGESPYRGLH